MALIAGVDEAGRGPLAGPVVAAAVILRDGEAIPGVRDSKKLSATQRERLVPLIKAAAQSWCIASASVAEIDELNILHATMLAMRRAIDGLQLVAGRLRVDGNRLPELPACYAANAEAMVRGDSRCPAIAAASILAKTDRDRQLRELHERFPRYGFDAHKGYPTGAHLAALAAYGVTPEHRRSFRPVREALQRGSQPA